MTLSDLKKLRNWDRDDYLKLIGLEERTPAGDFFTGLGLFAVGVLVGAGLGMLFAPKPGEEMRSQVTDVIRRRARQAQDFTRDLGMEAGSAMGSSSSPITGGGHA